MLVTVGTSFDPDGFGSSTDDFGSPPGIFTAFIVLFVVVFVVMVIVMVIGSIVRYTATRDMAKRRGASDADASTMALFGGGVGTAAVYLKDGSQMPGPTTAVSVPAVPAEAGPGRSVEERVREVRELETKGLITAEQATARVDEILRSVRFGSDSGLRRVSARRRVPACGRCCGRA